MPHKNDTLCNGLSLSEAFYRTHGAPMLHQQFPDIEDKIAVGLVGQGSECFGYDDEISHDHDFEPGFCLFVPDDTDRKKLFALERAYAKLPDSFEGARRLKLSPVGGNRHGVMTVSEFYINHTGFPQGPETPTDWMRLPSYALATATNGKVFRDDSDTFSAIRRKLLVLPPDVRKKKLSAHLLLAAQAGQYNYPRILSHGEAGAAQLALVEFVKNALQIAFLLEQKHPPFYKWIFRAFRDLPRFAAYQDALLFLITTENTPTFAKQKQGIVEDLARLFLCLIEQEGLLPASAREAAATGAPVSHIKATDRNHSLCETNDLERAAYALHATIKDPALRASHILAFVQE